MVVKAGREFLAIPGPTTMPDEVLQAGDASSGPRHLFRYDGAADGWPAARSQPAVRDQGAFVSSTSPTAMAHGKAVLSNVLSRGDKILVLESGRFALGWGSAASAMGVEVEVLKGDIRRAVRPAEVEARLRRDTDRRIKAIVVGQIDTASGVYNDIRAIGRAIKAAGHDALFMVDAVASLGCMPFEMDAWGVDVAMSASQKGLMTPPGLGFVAVNNRARCTRPQICAHPAGTGPSATASSHYRKYSGTAPVHLLFARRQALDMLFAEGLDNTFLRHRLLAETVRRAVSAWSEGQVLSFNIADPAERADTVTTVRTADGYDPTLLQGYCKDKSGVVLGTGIGDLAGRAF